MALAFFLFAVVPAGFAFASVDSPATAAVPVLSSKSSATTATPQIIQEPKIRVLVSRKSTVEISGENILVNDNTLLKNRQVIRLRCSNGRLYIKNKRSASAMVELKSSTGFIFVNGHPYRDEIRVIAKRKKCNTVNLVKMEHYLASSINSEMGESSSMEALKAQAVAARSYAYYKISINHNRDFDVESTVADQVYRGSAKESFRSHQAVAATRGWVLNSNERILKAYYHSSCGGQTTTPKIVWGEDNNGNYRPVMCPLHSKKKKTWSHFVSNMQLRDAISKVAGIPAPSNKKLASLRPGIRDSFSRLQTVVVKDEKGSHRHIMANKLRQALNPYRVKSTRFALKRLKQGFRLVGNGFGHGVGMCQKGAKHMARLGASYLKILHRYYPQARLQRLYY